MFQLFVERRHFRDFVIAAIDFDALEAALLQFGKVALIFALATADNGRQQIEPCAAIQCHKPVNHLADGLAFNRQAGGGRIGDTDARIEQAQIVVNLRHRTNGGTRVARGGFLLNGDGR